MEGYPVFRNWLTRRLRPGRPGWDEALRIFADDYQEGDEIWYFDEPAPPDVNAGAMGICLVRKNQPIRSRIQGLH